VEIIENITRENADDVISIVLNELIQFTMSIQRNDPKMEELYERMIEKILLLLSIRAFLLEEGERFFLKINTAYRNEKKAQLLEHLGEFYDDYLPGHVFPTIPNIKAKRELMILINKKVMDIQLSLPCFQDETAFRDEYYLQVWERDLFAGDWRKGTISDDCSKGNSNIGLKHLLDPAFINFKIFGPKGHFHERKWLGNIYTLACVDFNAEGAIPTLGIDVIQLEPSVLESMNEKVFIRSVLNVLIQYSLKKGFKQLVISDTVSNRTAVSGYFRKRRKEFPKRTLFLKKIGDLQHLKLLQPMLGDDEYTELFGHYTEPLYVETVFIWESVRQ